MHYTTTELKQLHRHNPEEGVYGDCHRTAVACVLGLDDPAKVPHYIGEQLAMEANGVAPDVSWDEMENAWLHKHYGLRRICFYLLGTLSLEEVRNMVEKCAGPVVYLLCGLSPRNTNHIVVCRGKDYMHDPHPDGGGLVAPMQEGVWEVSYFTPFYLRGDSA